MVNTKATARTAARTSGTLLEVSSTTALQASKFGACTMAASSMPTSVGASVRGTVGPKITTSERGLKATWTTGISGCENVNERHVTAR